MNIPRQLLLALGLICALSVAGADSFYKEPYGIFSTRPDAKKSLQTIKRFGPVGLGIDLIQPAFTMRIANVEEGSPAAATGKLAKDRSLRTSMAVSWPISIRVFSSANYSLRRKLLMAC